MVKFENTIQKYCGLLELNGKTSHHMGSTSIIGMPGKPLIDFTIITDKLLPDIPNDCIDELKKIGYIY